MEPVRTAVVFAATALLPVLLAGGQAQASRDDPAVRSQVELLATWAQEEEILDAVVAQNEQRTNLEEILELDERWVAGDAQAELEVVLASPCAERLEELLATDQAYREGLVVDAQGALVCLTGPSDDWQGDEAKWQRAFDAGQRAVEDGGGQVFVDRPRSDSSARAILVQISVPISIPISGPIERGGRTIGVLTVGVDRDHLER